MTLEDIREIFSYGFGVKKSRELQALAKAQGTMRRHNSVSDETKV